MRKAAGRPMEAETYRRCRGHKKDGSPCGKPPIAGGTVCTTHGGGAPQVKFAARQRLMELREPALVALGAVLRNAEADDSTKVRAALGILDRTGMGPNVQVDVGVTKPWEVVLAQVARGAGVAVPEGVDVQAIDASEVEELKRENRKLKKKLRRAGSIPGEVVSSVREDDDDFYPPAEPRPALTAGQRPGLTPAAIQAQYDAEHPDEERPKRAPQGARQSKGHVKAR